MLRVLIYFALAAVAISMMLAEGGEGAVAVLVTALAAGATILIFRRQTDDNYFIVYVFLAGLAARLAFGLAVHNFQLWMFFGPDSGFYHDLGSGISDLWLGYGDPNDPVLINALSLRGPGWGMNYLVAAIYVVIGKNFLAAQALCAVVGAATAPLVYLCSHELFRNRRAARFAAVAVALYPAFVIWSSQLLKDGLLIFLLVLSIMLVLRIQKKFTLSALAFLIFALFGILSLRFYIFYMVATAVAGSFVIGVGKGKGLVKRFAVLVIVGFGLTYLGVFRTASVDLATYGSLERIQVSRSWQATQSESGFGADQDVSTVGGALAVLPIGFTYLMFAPFPWEVKNLRQGLTLPDIFIWWSMWPFIIYGTWYTLRHKLRPAFPVLIFTVLLTISYAVFQGNVGTAYRQRTQIQVFLFMFAAVAWSIMQEKMEDRKLLEQNRKRALEQELRARSEQRRRHMSGHQEQLS